MKVRRNLIVRFLYSRGDRAAAGRAQRDLPVRLETDHYRELLLELGVAPEDLLADWAAARLQSQEIVAHPTEVDGDSADSRLRSDDDPDVP